MEKQKQYIPPEILQLMELGRQGKLWAMTIIHSVPGTSETKMVHKRNMTAEQMKTERETMFKYGLPIAIAADHWKIVCPMDILEVDLIRQTSYLPEVV